MAAETSDARWRSYITSRIEHRIDPRVGRMNHGLGSHIIARPIKYITSQPRSVHVKPLLYYQQLADLQEADDTNEGDAIVAIQLYYRGGCVHLTTGRSVLCNQALYALAAMAVGERHRCGRVYFDVDPRSFPDAASHAEWQQHPTVGNLERLAALVELRINVIPDEILRKASRTVLKSG